MVRTLENHMPMNSATKPAPGRFYAEKGRTMFAKIGFFHFGKKHAEPFDELRKELERVQQCKGPLAGSLIVLPEGFNIRKLYTDTTRVSSRWCRAPRSEEHT